MLTIIDISHFKERKVKVQERKMFKKELAEIIKKSFLFIYATIITRYTDSCGNF